MSGSTIAIRSADLGCAVNVSAEIDDTAGAAGRSGPATGLVSATIALDGRATGSSTVGERPAIGATGPFGTVRPMSSGSSTARSLSSAGRSDPVTGLVSATIALDGRATGSSTVGEMPAITGPFGTVRPMGSGSSTARSLSNAGRSDPVTGLVSATIALDGRATGSSTVEEMPAIGATGPSGAVRPMGSGSSTARRLSTAKLSLTSPGSLRSVFKCCTSWMVQSTRSISVMFASYLHHSTKPTARPTDGSDPSVQLASLSLAFDDLEEAIAANADAKRRLRMNGRLPCRGQNPIFAVHVIRQTGARHRRQAQRAVGSSAINVIHNRPAHRLR